MKQDSLQLISAAWERRKEQVQALEGQTNAFRLFSGAREGIPGIVFEKLANVGILQCFEGKTALGEAGLKQIATYYIETLGLDAVYLKTFIADRSHKTADDAMLNPTPFVGKAVNSSITILENSLSFEMHPYDGFSTGLFLDQRLNRAMVASHSKNKKVLNLFSYTGGFSVAAAHTGAQTTSIDVSKKYLDWAKRNFELNGIALENHRFIREDALTFLERAVKRGDRYGTIVLDPPSFGRSDKKVFSLKNDFRQLLAATFTLLEPDGVLFFSCNLQEWAPTFFEKLVFGFARQERRVKEYFPIRVPFDFQNEEEVLRAVCLVCG